MSSNVVRLWAVGAFYLVASAGYACGYLDEDLEKTRGEWRASFGERTTSIGIGIGRAGTSARCGGALYRAGYQSTAYHRVAGRPRLSVRGRSGARGAIPPRRPVSVFAIGPTGFRAILEQESTEDEEDEETD